MLIYLYLGACIISICYILPYAIKRGEQKILSQRCKSRRAIVLTYDDGPSSTLTEQLLSMLSGHNVHATFFVIGRKLEALENVASEYVNAGHELGSHSYAHLHAWKKFPLAVYRDIDRGLRLSGLHSKCKLYRPPYGKTTLLTMLQVRLNSFRHAWWTIDSSDTWEKSLPIDNILDQIRRDGGGVVLLHDHDRVNNPDRQTYVLSLTSNILEMARKEGYSIVPMGKLFTD